MSKKFTDYETRGRRWLRLVHKLMRPAPDTVERMQKGTAYKVDSKK